MTLLDTVILQLKMKGALLFRAVPLAQAQAASIALVKAGFLRIPRGYLKFLAKTDGLSYGDLELFSCQPNERAGTVFNQPDLLSYHQKYAVGSFWQKRLILGRGAECLLCYDGADKSYQLLARDGLGVVLKFPRFEDLLYYLVN